MSTATTDTVGAPTEGAIDEVAVGIGADIDCECTLCHLPLDHQHGPVRWRVVVHSLGPYPRPGDLAMMLCDPCEIDWVGNTDEFPGNLSIARVHRI